MKFLYRVLLTLILATPVLTVALVWFSLSAKPLIATQTELSHHDVARARQILRDNDLSQLPDGTRRSIVLTEQDMNLAGNYLLQKTDRGAARIAITPGVMDIFVTVRLPLVLPRPYLNVTLNVEDRGNVPYVNNLRLGQVPIPDVIARFMVGKALARANRTDEFKLASDVVKDLSLEAGALRLTYEWRSDLIDEVRSAVLSTADRAAVRAYYDRLVDPARQEFSRRGSLTAVLESMFALASERSREGHARTENRALLLVLGSWGSGRGMGGLVPATPTRPPRFRVRLDGRYDFAQHFLTSAALVAGGDSALSEAVGLFKEVSDADGGSGFSFTDLAADRAGTRFGQLATASNSAAAELQATVAAGLEETDIMPAVKDLPERLTDTEFQTRYGGVDGVPYREILDEIERRISACRLYAK